MTYRSTTGPVRHGAEPPVPRAARQVSVIGLLLIAGFLVWFSPVALVLWPVALLVILRQTRWHWQVFALVALAVTAAEAAAIGPETAVRLHFYVPVHFWEYVALAMGYGPPGTRLSWFELLRDLVVSQIWFAVPIATLTAAVTVWYGEQAAAGAEWDPLLQRRQEVEQRRLEHRVRKLLASEGEARFVTPPLGVALDGDLPAWVQGKFAVPPADLRGKAMAVIGAPGSGKTVTLLRLAYIAGTQGQKVTFADCKGTDPTLAGQLIAAYRLGNPNAKVGQWPASPMDMWRGTPSQMVSRLLAVEDFSEPWYQRVASTGLRLALTAPDAQPVTTSAQLLARMDAAELLELWQGSPLHEQDARAIAEHLPGARLRYADFFAALGGAFDRGNWSFEDVDLAILTVPTLLSKAEADAAMRVVLEDYGHYATGRKPREGEDALLILDEFSALTSGVDSAISLAERVRDVGVQVVVAAQSVEGLGTERQAARLLAACAGGVLVHQCPDPDVLLELAGVVRQVEHNWELDRWGARGKAKARMTDRPRVDAEQVRAARPGEAWIIQAGRALHLRILRPPAPVLLPVLPASVVDDPVRAQSDIDTAPLPTVRILAHGRRLALLDRLRRPGGPRHRRTGHREEARRP